MSVRLSPYKQLLVILLLVFTYRPSAAQSLSFQGITRVSGIVPFWHTAIDQNGFIWAASRDGLFMYDGYSMQQYSAEAYPGLPSNIVGSLQCDSRNRIWIQTNRGIALMDENRHLQRIPIEGYIPKEGFDYAVFEVPGPAYVAITTAGCFHSTDGIQNWKPYPWLSDLLGNSGIIDVRKFDDESLLLCVRGKRILLLNFKKEKVLLNITLPRAMGVCRLNEEEILAGADTRWGLYRIDVKTKQIVKQYESPKDATGKKILSGVVTMAKAIDDYVYISTRKNGLLRFDPVKETFENFTHDPLDKNTILSDRLHMVTTDQKGMLVVTTNMGISFTDLGYSMMKQQPYFTNEKGLITDELVRNITTDHSGNLWIATYRTLLKWDRRQPVSSIIWQAPDTLLSEPSTLATDLKGNIWMGTGGEGIFVFNDKGQQVKRIYNIPPLSNEIRVIRRLHNGQMIAGTENGLFRIDPSTYIIDTFITDQPLQQLLTKRITDILPIEEDLWIAVSPRGGVYHYNFNSKQLKLYDEKSGLSINRPYCLAADKSGNIYAGTLNGLSIISKNGTVSNLDKSNGLANNQVESIVADDQDIIWFSNEVNITRYDPKQKSLFIYDRHNGINDISFLIGGTHRTTSGELFFSTTRGIFSFQPKDMKLYKPPLKIYIFHLPDRKSLPDSVAGELRYSYKEGKVIFQVAASDITGNQQIFYRYRMQGLDSNWSLPTQTRTIAYNLQPGKYTFLVQASYDRVNYISTSEPVSISVAYPFWKKGWFMALVILLAIASVAILFHNRVRVLRKKMQVQQQLLQLEAKALRAQMNPHFIFNSLNAIQELIVTESYDSSYQYLSKFSRLLRMVLHNSEKNMIPLSEEIEMAGLYLELESLRFKHSFYYSITADKKLDTDGILFPTLLVQPFLENAIWHGLLPKKGDKKLSVVFEEKDNLLVCTITDNGIGREKASVIRSAKMRSLHMQSKGINLVQQRLDAIRAAGVPVASLDIEDNKDGNGTIVRITLSSTNSIA